MMISKKPFDDPGTISTKLGNHSVSIVTQRFLLREYLRTDEADFIRYQTDPNFAIYYSAKELGADHARAVFQTFMAWQIESPRLKFQFAVCHSDDSMRLIGSCGIRRDSQVTGEADFGIELARPYWGKYRFAIEISNAVITWAFSELQLSMLTADTALENTVAARLAERGGFQRVATRERHFWRLDRDDWKPPKI